MYKKTLLLAFSLLLFLPRGSAEPIKLHPNNPHYYLFNGRPTILITSAEHYGGVVNKDFDYVAYFDALKAYGMNYTRIYPGFLFEPMGKFMKGNTLGAKPISLILPWARRVEQLGIAGFGWGVAWLAGDGVHRYRSAASLAVDAEGARSAAAVRSSRFLVHLRRPNRLSTVQLSDSQPFLDAPGEDAVGTIAFCHNGFLERHEELRPRYQSHLRGRADSEVGFEFFKERVDAGTDPAAALAEVHERLGGTANLGSLGPKESGTSTSTRSSWA